VQVEWVYGDFAFVSGQQDPQTRNFAQQYKPGGPRPQDRFFAGEYGKTLGWKHSCAKPVGEMHGRVGRGPPGTPPPPSSSRQRAASHTPPKP
jgi:hypothetical protein